MLWEIQLYFSTFDGVVNTLMIYKDPIKARRLLQKDEYYFDLCYPQDKRVSNTQAVLWLEKLCKEFNADIVITSTWRKDFDLARESLYNSGLSKDVKIIGATPWFGVSRGIEIKEWLKKNPCQVFIILDDDCDMEDLVEHLILVDNSAGFTSKDYRKAAALFEQQLSQNRLVNK